MSIARLQLVFILVAASAVALAQSPTPSVSVRPPSDAPPPKANPPGPYVVTMQADPGLPTHTIYRPQDLSAFKGQRRLPIVSWGNGACANAGRLFQEFLTQVASHGYMVIAIGPLDAPLPAFAQGANENATQPAPTAPASGSALAARSHDAQIIDAIDWALQENARKGSPYYRRLHQERIAVMGQSCGGLQAIVASGDPRVRTSIIWNSGAFPDASDSLGNRLSSARKASLQKFHAPVAYFAGGPADVAYANTEDDFKRIDHVAVFKGNINVGHGGTYRHPGGGWFGEVGVAWLNWQLKGDKAAAKYFVGADCILCTNPLWKIEKKKLD